MSEENVDAIREAYAAWVRGDVAEIIDGTDPDVEIIQPRELPDSKSYRGHRGVREALDDWPKQWDEFRVELVELIDASDTQVISVGCHHVRARGMDMEQEVFNVHTFRDELLIRWEMYLTRNEALEAAGLSE